MCMLMNNIYYIYKIYETIKELFAQKFIQQVWAFYLGLGGGAFTGHLSGAERGWETDRPTRT